MATAVGEGAAECLQRARVLELALKARDWLPTASVLLIWVRASCVFSWARCKEAACCPIRREAPGNPPSRGLGNGPRPGGGALSSVCKEKLELQTNTTKEGVIGLDCISAVKVYLWGLFLQLAVLLMLDQRTWQEFQFSAIFADKTKTNTRNKKKQQSTDTESWT